MSLKQWISVVVALFVVYLVSANHKHIRDFFAPPAPVAVAKKGSSGQQDPPTK